MKKIIMMSTTDFKHNCKGDYHLTMIDLFDIAPIVEWKMKNEGAAGKNQRLPDKQHVVKMVKQLRKEGELCLWAMMIGIDCDLIKSEEIVDNDGNNQTIHYIMWPETPEEIEKYAPSIQIGDGQHRGLAASSQYNLKESFGSFPVAAFFLDHPTEEDMIRRFCQINGRGKNMSKDLLFEFNKRLGELEESADAMYQLLKMAHADENSPLYGRVKFGYGSGFSSMTIVNKTCNKTRDLIKAMEDVGLKNIESQYKAFNSYLIAVCESLYGTGCRKFGKLSTTRLAYSIAMMEPILKTMKDNKVRRTVVNFKFMFAIWTNRILRVNNMLLCDNSEMTYIDTDGNVTKVTDRWNGQGSVELAIQKDTYLFSKAYNGELNV
jgi:hypothetical protein